MQSTAGMCAPVFVCTYVCMCVFICVHHPSFQCSLGLCCFCGKCLSFGPTTGLWPGFVEHLRAAPFPGQVPSEQKHPHV